MRSRIAIRDGVLLGALITAAGMAVLVAGFPQARGAEPTTQDAEAAHPKYLGAKGCKLCHIAPSTGAQFKVWDKGPHRKAFEVLGTDEAKKAATAKGITGDPQQAPECLKCHVTGYGEPAERFSEKYSKEEGVSCESCHGAGEHYATKEVFEKGRDEAIRLGLHIPTEKTCTKCHNPESPNYKEFNFEEFKKKIEHPKPKSEGGK